MTRNANSWIRGATLFSVCSVAAIAAVISYSHILHVALTHGQTDLDARLLPLSVDGLILAASLTAFFASRNKLPIPALARWMLIAGILATVAANALYGLSHGLLGAVLSSWPALSFIGTVELSISTVRMAVTGRPVRTSRTRRSEERSWARDQGYEVGERGRLPSEVTEAYAQHVGSSVTETLPAETVPATNGHVEVVPGNVPDWLVKT
jgi:Protein of unknown function (DUF2637)/Lsr2